MVTRRAVAPTIRLVRKRVRHDATIVGAAFATILLATTLLAAGPIYSDAVSQAALRRTLADAVGREASLVVELRAPPDRWVDVDRVVTGILDDVAPGRISVELQASTESFEIDAVATDRDVVDLVTLRHLEGVEGNAELRAGRWPGPGSSSPLEVAIGSSAADQLGIGIGGRIDATSRRAGDVSIALDVVGVFEIDAPEDAFWADIVTAEAGVVDTGAFRTFGPVVIHPAALTRAIAPRLDLAWIAQLDPSAVELADVDGIVAAATAVPARLEDALEPDRGVGGTVSEATVDDGLDLVLRTADRSLAVTRTSVLALVLQLAILAGYALVLTAGLLVASRRAETDLIRARGASPAATASIGFAEALLLTVPAALLAPAIARAAVGLLDRWGPLAGIELTLDPAMTDRAWLLVALASVVAVSTLVWPAWRAARAYGRAERTTRRFALRSASQRAGVDLALVALAGVAFWQLATLGEDRAASVQGRFDVDPLLVVAPALGLFAGAVIALRVVPVLARLVERAVAARRGLVGALAGWQIARRPQRYARAALLLIASVSIGVFAASYAATWSQSQEDQADHRVGADLRVQPNRRTGDSLGDLHIVPAHEAVEGVTASMPVLRRGGGFPGSSIVAQYLFVDAAKAADVVEARADVVPQLAEQMEALVSGRPRLGGVDLPHGAQTVQVVAEATEEEILVDEEPLELAFRASVSAIVQTGDALLHRLELGDIDSRSGPIELATTLAGPVAGSGALAPSAPVRVVAFEIRSLTPELPPRRVTFDFLGMIACDAAGRCDDVAVDWSNGAWQVETTTAGGLDARPSVVEVPGQPAGRLRLAIETGAASAAVPIVFGVLATGTEWPDALPVIVTERWLSDSSSEIGERTRVPALAVDRDRVEVVGAVESFPTVDPAVADAVIVDLASFAMLSYEPGRTMITASEHWLAVDGDPEAVAAVLRAEPIEAVSIVDRLVERRRATVDPVGVGTLGALALGFVASAVVAAVGFAVSIAVSARERMTEFAMLRALGLSRRGLSRWISLEHTALVLVSFVAGTAVGAAVSATVLPLITLTQGGAQVVPDVRVVHAWADIVVLELVLLAALGLVVAVTTLVLRRLGVGRWLRLGVDE